MIWIAVLILIGNTDSCIREHIMNFTIKSKVSPAGVHGSKKWVSNVALNLNEEKLFRAVKDFVGGRVDNGRPVIFIVVTANEKNIIII